jgi:Xaa-Pro aminopeptidase
MPTDPERLATIVESLRKSRTDAYICSSSPHVLLLTGYSPVLGNSVAVCTASGQVVVVVPEDELEIAQATTSARLIPYRPAAMDRQTSAFQELSLCVAQATQELGLATATIGHETNYSMRPATYVSTAAFSRAFTRLLRKAIPGATLQRCGAALCSLAARKTSYEVDRLRTAVRIASSAFEAGPRSIHPGATEPEIASSFQAAFDTSPHAAAVQRSFGSFFCMSGPHSSAASAAYARTRRRTIERGDIVMIHANTCADGFWTDITRTYIAGDPSPRQTSIQTAIAEARHAALAAIRPGVTGDQVDRAARDVMTRHGFGAAFRHPTGHGLGFEGISGEARPRIHPAYTDPIEQGSTFNIEPAAYFDGYGGMRHCDMVAVTATGVEVLTDF